MKNGNDLLPGGKNDPFNVPDNFFEDFKTELLQMVDKGEERKLFSMLKTGLKYAAVLGILFFAGKGVLSTIEDNSSQSFRYTEPAITVDQVYMEISERELTEYIMEEHEKDLPFYTDF